MAGGSARPSRRVLLIGALLFSGFAALSVEVLWQRLLARLLGGSTAATTAVLMAYMGGLALGGALAARRGDRLAPRDALHTYAWLEASAWIGVSLATLILAGLEPGLGGKLAALPEGAARFFGRFALATFLLSLPTTLMGATLPFAVRAYVAGAGGDVLKGAGALYAANTAGAVLGALAGSFLLMPALGVRGAALAGACGSLLAALLALAVRLRDGSAPVAEAAASEGNRVVPLWPIALATFATGATALGLEVVWFRSLGTLAGSSVYAFSVVLALVLGGVALGAAVISALGHRVRDAATACGFASATGGGLAVVLFPLLDHIPDRFAQLAARKQLTFGSSLETVLALGALVVLPSTLCFGAALPLAVRAACEGSSHCAAATGRVLASNTLGALTGAAVTGLWLLPALGLSGASALVAAVATASGGVLLAFAGGSRRKRALGATLGCAMSLVCFVAPPYTPSAAAGGSHDPHGAGRPARQLYFAEGAEASVLVTAVGSNRTFFVAGRAEASDGWIDLRNQYLLGHLPALLAGGAKRSLVIALGSGMTAGSLTVHGDVTIAELNRAVPGAARQFSDLNHDVLSRAQLRIEDGRVVLAESGPRYDVITTDPIHPYVAGSASLYTTEHLRHCRERLTPGGAVSIWVPLQQMGPSELKAIIGSFVDVFPDAELYLSYYNAILVGGGRRRNAAEGLALLREGWSASVAEDMRKAVIESPEELAVSRVAGADQLRAFVEGARRNLDDDPWIELSLPLFVRRSTLQENLEALLALRPADERASPEARQFEAVQRAQLQAGAGRNERALAVLGGASPGPSAASAEYRKLLREASAQHALSELQAGRPDKALVLARAEVASRDATLESLVRAGSVLQLLGDWPTVDRAHESLRLRWPAKPEGWLWTGEALVVRARFEEAIPYLRRAAVLDRFQGHAALIAGLLGRALLMTGAIEEGRNELRRSVALWSKQPEVERLLAASPETLLELRRQLELRAATAAHERR